MGKKLSRFANHKRVIWPLLAEQLGGEFFKGNMVRSDRVEAYHENWVIVLDWYADGNSTSFTRIRAPYVNRDDFTFKITRENSDHRIKKFFGKQQDVEVGYPEFDRDFVIQGSDERKLRMMFANPKIRELISYQPKITLQIREEAPLFTKPQFPADVNELYFRVSGNLTNLEQLHDLFDLFAEALDHLCAIGTAYEDDPNFLYHT